MIQWINKKRNKKGFTLIELVVVIAILGILAAIAIPRLTGSRINATRTSLEANLRTIDSAITIAEAEGKLDATFKSAAKDARLTSIKDLGYLAAVPVTDGASYGVIGDGTAGSPYRAAVSVVSDDITKFDLKAAIDDKKVEDLDWATLGN